jgi:uroporphyrinogen decarboxylase
MMAELSSKELVKGLFQLKNPPRRPFIPWVGAFAAQLEQITPEEMMTDPGLLSTSLLGAQQLFGYDAIATVFDASLEAEACGCEIEWPDDGSGPRTTSHPLEDGAPIEGLDIPNLDRRGRIPTVLEAVKRIGIVRGKQVAIIGVITGPLTLARQLTGDGLVTGLNEGSAESLRTVEAAGAAGLRLCRKYCESGVDAIVVAEEMLADIKPGLMPTIAPSLKSMWNVARFFGVHSLVLSRRCRMDMVEPLLALQAEGVAVSGEVDYEKMREAALNRRCCYGQSIPDGVLCGTVPTPGGGLRDGISADGRGSFLTTEWDVPRDADVNAMHDLMRAVRGG